MGAEQPSQKEEGTPGTMALAFLLLASVVEVLALLLDGCGSLDCMFARSTELWTLTPWKALLDFATLCRDLSWVALQCLKCLPLAAADWSVCHAAFHGVWTVSPGAGDACWVVMRLSGCFFGVSAFEVIVQDVILCAFGRALNAFRQQHGIPRAADLSEQASAIQMQRGAIKESGEIEAIVFLFLVFSSLVEVTALAFDGCGSLDCMFARSTELWTLTPWKALLDFATLCRDLSWVALQCLKCLPLAAADGSACRAALQGIWNIAPDASDSCWVAMRLFGCGWVASVFEMVLHEVACLGGLHGLERSQADGLEGKT